MLKIRVLSETAQEALLTQFALNCWASALQMSFQFSLQSFRGVEQQPLYVIVPIVTVTSPAPVMLHKSVYPLLRPWPIPVPIGSNLSNHAVRWGQAWMLPHPLMGAWFSGQRGRQKNAPQSYPPHLNFWNEEYVTLSGKGLIKRMVVCEGSCWGVHPALLGGV